MNRNKTFNFVEERSKKIRKVAYDIDMKISKMMIKRRLDNPRLQLSIVSNFIELGEERINYINEKSFDSVLNSMEKNLANNYSVNFTKKELGALSLKGSTILDDTSLILKKYRIGVKKLLLQNMGKGLSMPQVVKGLKTLYPNFAQHCYTVANTGLQRIYKDGNFTKTSKLFEEFKYLGPDDNVTRPFCAEHVGKVYNKKEAEQLQSEIMGFFNCRHSLEPVDESLLTKKPILKKSIVDKPIVEKKLMIKKPIIKKPIIRKSKLKKPVKEKPIVEKPVKTTKEEVPITISSQKYLDEDIVLRKIENEDFSVQYINVEIEGKDYRIVVDGHHSIEAAKRAGKKVDWEYSEVMQNEYKNLEVSDIMEKLYMDSDWYDIKTGNNVWQ